MYFTTIPRRPLQNHNLKLPLFRLGLELNYKLYLHLSCLNVYRGYYMAARGCEFYLRVLTGSLASERSLLYRYWWNVHIKYNFFIHFRNRKKWSSIAKCLSKKCYESQIWSYEEDIKKIIFIFSVRKSQNSNKEEKNSITLPSSHPEAIFSE